ncbi:MAG: hypothetical protein HYW63_03550 [Candidatus Levybacteria bacterium]|nr:hypothetical protein [Candidatus Levybacteria bacterium]
MVTVVHGSDQISSRNFFLEQKDKDSLTFDAENINVVDLEQSLQGGGLFGATTKVFIENLFTKKGLKSLEDVAEVINKSKNADIYLWADREQGVKNLSAFPKYLNQNFKIPQNIWLFLDGIRPHNPDNVLHFHETILTTEPEIVFAMVIRQFRLMLGLMENSDNTIDEVKRLAPWQRGKLTRQASIFGLEKLKKTYKKLYKIDKSQKTGTSKLSLTQNIDILMLEI